MSGGSCALQPFVTDTDAVPVSRRDVGLRSARGPVLLAVMLSTALVALDQTIVSTAVPSIVDDLGGFGEFPWLFSVYLLAQAATVPVNGKLADLFGRKPLMYYGIALFLLGSVLCAVAWSMPVLIAARALQGLGAGAVQPIGMTVIGDIYSLRERAKVQGYVASVWGISSVVGPAVGGAFSQLLTWRFIFWVNVPLCLLAAWMLRRFDERVERRSAQVDYAGAALLTLGTTLVVLGLLEGGRSWAWGVVADPGGLRCRGRSCWPPSCWSSAAWPSRSCRCGCSPAARWWSAPRCRSWWADCSWASRRTCPRWGRR